MPRLLYLAEPDLDELIDLSHRAFPDARASGMTFALRGLEGRHLITSAFSQAHWPHHRQLPSKAAVLHYHLSNNHPFLDGNKRFALTSMTVFLARNRALLLASNDDLLEWSLSVADGSLGRAESARFVRLRTIRGSWTRAGYDRWAKTLMSDPQELLRVGQAAVWVAEHGPNSEVRQVGAYAAELLLETAASAGIEPARLDGMRAGLLKQ